MLHILSQIRKCLRIVFFLYGTFYAISQEKSTSSVHDSLVGKDYTYLLNQSIKNYTDSIIAQLYLNAYLDKASIENNKVEKARALSYLAHYAKNKTDAYDIFEKAFAEIEGLENEETIPIYIHIGSTYDSSFEYEAAIIHYLKALHIAQNINSEYFEYVLYNNIARVKDDIGKHQEALTLYKKSLTYNENIKSIDTIINSLNIAASYRHIKKYDSASYYYHKIIDSDSFKANNDFNRYLKSIFTVNEGINLYYKKNYAKAETLLNEGISELTSTSNSDSKTYYIHALLYLGKIYQGYHKNEEQAKEYYTTIDSLLSTTDIIIPETREVYEFFFEYYERKKEYKKQLDAINKLRQLDAVISSRNIKVTDQLYSKFDTPQLIKSKETLIKKLEDKTKSKEILIEKLEDKTKSFKANITYLIICITILLILFFFQFNKHKQYKKRFEVIVSKLDNEKTDIIQNEKTSIPKQLNIDPTIIETTLERLELFEANKEFLQSDINIAITSKKCETNTKYLSKIINTHKGKSFSNYINDLRIDYILKELKENIILQRYTIKTISEEAGFNNADSFTKAFKKRTGITPSYYLKNLKSI